MYPTPGLVTFRQMSLEIIYPAPRITYPTPEPPTRDNAQTCSEREDQEGKDREGTKGEVKWAAMFAPPAITRSPTRQRIIASGPGVPPAACDRC